MEIFALVMALVGLVWFVGAIPAIAKSWNTAPKYYNVARLLLPTLIVGVFLPRLFIVGFPANYPWTFWLMILLLFYISGSVLFYLYREPGDYTPRPVMGKAGEIQLLTQNGELLPMVDHRLDETVQIRPAQSQDLIGVGEVFAQVFGHTFDLSFGPDRRRNSRILADLLTLKIKELLVAVAARDEVVGAVWLDLAATDVPKAEPKIVHPIMRKYMGWWDAFYFANLGVPGMMAVRANREQGYIQWLGVRPQWQGHHVARKLMEQAEELSRQAGKKTLALHTERANKPARALYEHLGFAEKGAFRFGPRVFYVKDL